MADEATIMAFRQLEAELDAHYKTLPFFNVRLKPAPMRSSPRSMVCMPLRTSLPRALNSTSA